MSWKKTTSPFERVHADHFVFEGKTFLVLVDDYSNWIEVYPNKSSDTESVIRSLRQFCATFGIPKLLVTDNGTAFTSKLFKTFCKVNGIEHKTSPPYHLQSNGLAERAVGIVKNNPYKSRLDPKPLPIEIQLLKFLQKSHSTPLSDCQKSPSQLIFNFPVRNAFSQMERRESHKLEQLPDCDKIIKSSQIPSSYIHPKKTWNLINGKNKGLKVSTKRKVIDRKNREVKNNEIPFEVHNKLKKNHSIMEIKFIFIQVKIFGLGQ